MDDSMTNLKYHYLNKKIIEVKMKEKTDLKEQDGIKVLKNKGNSFKIEIDGQKRSVTDVIKMLDADNIVDINIASIPLEDIITQIYRGEKQWKNIYTYTKQH